MTRVSQVYGDALYELSADEKLVEVVKDELELLEDCFRRETAFLKLLADPAIAKAERTQIVDDCFKGSLNSYVLNFLKLLTEEGHISQFGGCCERFKERFNEDRGILPVSAVSAVELPEDLKKKLEKKLFDISGKEPLVTYTVKKECLGGLRLDFKGSRLDSTVRARLDEMKQLLKNTVL